MTDYTSLDVLQRSASTDQPPEVRSKTEVAKLIDVSRCIGCKACQVACQEWNDIRDGIGENTGVYGQLDPVADDIATYALDLLAREDDFRRSSINPLFLTG